MKIVQSLLNNNIAIIKLDLNIRNNFTHSDIIELTNCITSLEDDSECIGAIITGSNRCFSTGAEVTELLRHDSEEMVLNFFKEMDSLIMKLFSFKKPLVAAINGHSIGLGFLIQLCADYVISSDNGKIKFGLPETKIGLILDLVMLEVLNWNNINGKKLSNIILPGNLFNVQTAVELNVVDQLINEDDLIATSEKQVLDLIQGNQFCFEMNKMILRDGCLSRMKQSFNSKTYRLFVEILKNPETINKLKTL